MAGSGKHPGKEALKNKAMLVVRNVTKQEVTNVIFPNGLTVGTADLKTGAKIHGNAQIAGVLNAQDLRINGSPLTGTEGPRGLTGAGIFLNPPTVVLPADYNGNVDSADFALGDTSISAILGTETLPPDNTSPFSDNTFRVETPTGTGITPGSATHGSLDVTFSSPSSMTGDTASITYPVVLNISGSEATINIEQNYVKAKEPAPTPIANLTNPFISIESDYLGRDPSDSSIWSTSDLAARFDLATTGSVTAGTTDIVWDGSTIHGSPTNPDEGKFRLHAGGITGLTDQGTLIQYVANSGYSGEGDKDARFYVGTAFGIYHVALEIKNSDSSDTNSDPTIKLYQLGEWDNPTSGYSGGSTRFTTILLNIPFLVTIGGETVTLNRQMIINKNKQPVPDPVAHLTNDVINIPTDYLGRNPDDNEYFSAGSDFPAYAKTVLSVSAGSDDLTWYGDQYSATPSNPPEGNFLIDWRSVTGETENGTSLTYKSAGSFDSAGQDKDYYIHIGNSSSGQVTWLRITEDSSGNPDIDMSKLTEFDDNGLNSYTDGSQRFNVAALTIPINVTIGGVTQTIEKNLTIQKIREATPTPEVSISKSVINVNANTNGEGPESNNQYWGTSELSGDPHATVITVFAGGTELTWNGDENSSSPSDPAEGTFKIDWHNATGETDTGVAIDFGADGGNWDASPALDTSAELRYYNPSDGRILDWTTNSDPSSNGIKIQLDLLTSFTDADSSALNGSTNYDSLSFTFPVLATVGGSTVTIDKTVVVQKIKAPSDVTSLEVVVTPETVVIEVEDDGTYDLSSLSDTVAQVRVLDNGTALAIDDTSSPADSTWYPQTGDYKAGSGFSPSISTFTYTNGDSYAQWDQLTTLTSNTVFRSVNCRCMISGSEVNLTGFQYLSKSVTTFNTIEPIIQAPAVSLTKRNWTDNLNPDTLPSKPTNTDACDTRIFVYKNGTTINFDDSGSPANNTFSVTGATGVGIGNPTPGTHGSKYYQTGKPSASSFSGANNFARIDYTVRYVDGSGNFEYYTLRQSITLMPGNVRYGSFVVKGSIDFGSAAIPSYVASMQTVGGYVDVYIVPDDGNSDDNQTVDGYNSYLQGHELTGNGSSLWVELSGGDGDDIVPTIQAAGVGFERVDPTDSQTNSAIAFTSGKNIRLLSCDGTFKLDTLRFYTSGVGSGTAQCNFGIHLYAVNSEVSDPSSSSGPNRTLRYVASLTSGGGDTPLHNYISGEHHLSCDVMKSDDLGSFSDQVVYSYESLVALIWLDRVDKDVNVIPDSGVVTFGPIEVTYAYDF